MQTIHLEVRDDYAKMVLDFLKLLPESVAKIDMKKELSTELTSRIDDIKNNKVTSISRDELFDNI